VAQASPSPLTEYKFATGWYRTPRQRATCYSFLMEHFSEVAHEVGFPEGAVPDVLDEPLSVYLPGARTLSWRYAMEE
jgi:hypothetical protein